MEYATLNGAELVRAFNDLANSATGKELGVKPVNRFATTEIGRKRCEALASSIRARESGLAAADNQTESGPVAAEKTTEAVVRNSNGILEDFRTNPDKNNGKLLLALWGSKNKQLPQSACVKAIYGNQKEENVAPFTMVWRGINNNHKKHRLGGKYELVKKKNGDGELTYGIHTKA